MPARLLEPLRDAIGAPNGERAEVEIGRLTFAFKPVSSPEFDFINIYGTDITAAKAEGDANLVARVLDWHELAIRNHIKKHEESIRFLERALEILHGYSFTDDLAAAQQMVDPWTPLWSSAAFTLIVLIIACVYIERQEF